MNIRALILSVYDRLISLLPGTQADPDSFESRARRSVDLFSNEIDRIVARTDRAIGAVIAQTNAIEQRIHDEAVIALRNAEATAQAALRRAERLKQLIDGE